MNDSEFDRTHNSVKPDEADQPETDAVENTDDGSSADPETAGDTVDAAETADAVNNDADEHTEDGIGEARAEVDVEVEVDTDEGADEEPSLDFETWLHTIGTGAETDTMLRFTPTASNSIDITHAHPSGLTQFLSGRRTRLSTLKRDNEDLNAARRTALSLETKIDELAMDRGINVGYLAAGIASWRSAEAGVSRQMSAPVLLAQVRLTQRANRGDFDVHLTGKAKLNPALARWFENVYDIKLDPQEFQDAAYSTAKLEPMEALNLLRQHAQVVRGLVVEHRLLVSTFADLSDTASQDVVIPEHPVIKNLHKVLAGTDEAAVLAESETAHIEADELTPVDERDPADEVLILDLDPSQQEAVDFIAEGRSLVVSSPPGTGQTQTAAAAAIALAHEGYRVLVLAERTQTLDDFHQRLAERDLDHLVLSIEASAAETAVERQVIEAMLAAERAKEPATARVHDTVRDRRAQLIDHVTSLHARRERWGCTPFEAMQALAALSSKPDAPTTTVRLKRSVLDATVDRDRVAEQLRYAADLGAFTRSAVESPWYGARLHNVQEVESALGLAETVYQQLGTVRTKVRLAVEHSQLREGKTVADWVEQANLLTDVRISLDRFAPDIFDRPVNDLIAATASGAWRREHGIEMTALTRTRLRRVAREYVRPGVSVPDLHQALIEVQTELTAWNEWADSKRHPHIPSGLDSLLSDVEKLDDDMARLQEIMAPPLADNEKLRNLPIDDLEEVLERLLEDPDTLHSLPERTLVLDQLHEQGLGELLLDFQEREVSVDNVADELDLAWWQSVLEAMLSADDQLTMVNGEQLTKIEAEYRLADAAHLDLGAARVAWKLAQRWVEKASSMQTESQRLRKLMLDGTPDADDFGTISADLTQPLKPIWTTSPLALADLDESLRFDAVLLLDSETLGLSAGLGAVSRADQVVAFGDSVSGRPRGFQVSLDSQVRATPVAPESVHSALTRVLPQVPLKVMHRGVSQKVARFLGDQLYDGALDRMPTAEEFTGQPSTRGIEVEYLTEPGTPGFGDDGVESTTAEVTRTVDIVFDHFRNHPDQSLAVFTTTPLHARRIAEAVRVNLANHRWAMKFFVEDTAPGGEPFVVAPMERAHGIVRDAVVFTLGYGRTSHGSVVQHFGPLSESHGIEYYATVMTRARRSLRILSCIHPEEIQPRHVIGGARFFWELMAGLKTGHGFETVEAEDDFTSVEGVDPLTVDIAHRLHQRGSKVSTDPRSHADVAAWNPYPVALADGSPQLDRNQPVAIFSDGSTEFREMSVRERARLRPAAFEKLGWRCDPIWAIDAFAQPDAVTDELAARLGLSDEYHGNQHES